jgi:heme/copper-type cytochrome/quinol oxidase subunit 2
LPKPWVIAAIVAAIIFVGAIGFLSYSGFFNTTPPSGHVDHFTIIEETFGPLAGINGSANKPLNIKWPVITVHLGDTVVITIINNGTSEPHGFAIDHYYASGITTSPEKQNTISFVANEAGSFRVYCNVFCSIHPLMQNGVLIVKP